MSGDEEGETAPDAADLEALEARLDALEDLIVRQVDASGQLGEAVSRQIDLVEQLADRVNALDELEDAEEAANATGPPAPEEEPPDWGRGFQ